MISSLSRIRACILAGAICASVLAQASLGHAERWIQYHSDIFDIELCLDLDSIRTGSDGFTFFRDRDCKGGTVHQNAVRCAGDPEWHIFDSAKNSWWRVPGPIGEGSSAEKMIRLACRNR